MWLSIERSPDRAHRPTQFAPPAGAIAKARSGKLPQNLG